MEHPTHAHKNDLGQVKSLPKNTSRSRPDARKRGRPVWPFLGHACVFSITILFVRMLHQRPYLRHMRQHSREACGGSQCVFGSIQI